MQREPLDLVQVHFGVKVISTLVAGHSFCDPEFQEGSWNGDRRFSEKVLKESRLDMARIGFKNLWVGVERGHSMFRGQGPGFQTASTWIQAQSVRSHETMEII